MDLIVLGFGNVGQSFSRMLDQASTWLRERGIDINVVAMVDRGGAAISTTGINFVKALYTKELNGSVSAMRDVGKPNFSALQVLEEVEGDIVVEVTSTNFQTGEPGLTHIKKALRLGRNVVTTNKGSLAVSLQSLVDLAKRYKVKLRFSGAVGGALPVLDFAKKCLLPNEIKSIRGVLNGTTNYILWKMAEKQIRLPEAIGKAQELGYAEENIMYDLEGFDTACKLVILANWIMNRKVQLKDVKISGISNITLKEVLNARRKGCPIRLIGSINKKMKVGPERISKMDPLCVSSAMNAVSFNCTYSGQHLLIGMGAGGKETASSILRDIVNINREYKSSNLEKNYLYSIPSKNVKHTVLCGGIS